MISVQMLGVLTISLNGQRLSEDIGPAARRLAGYLFEFPGRVHRREQLVDQFWSHLDPPRARSAMNTALWRIRKLLAQDSNCGGVSNLRAHGSDIVLEPAPWLEIDTHAFSAGVEHLLGGDRDSTEQVAVLRCALDRYTGPFLDGEDADWILEERERLHTLHIRGLTELMRRHAVHNRFEDAIDAARRVLAADPFRESVHNSLSLLLVLNGQPAEALRRQKQWRELLSRELGIGPMPQTVNLTEAIRSGEVFNRLGSLKSLHFGFAEEPV
jgi:DNA-binding SARP family transcriptional activator